MKLELELILLSLSKLSFKLLIGIFLDGQKALKSQVLGPNYL